MNSKTFTNPVFRHSFPDPFVLKFCGEYFGYCTGHWDDGSIFGVIRSRDLVNWTVVGGAMKPLDTDLPFYWAPEVTYSNGLFYLYYSVGNEALMEIRVATSDRPDGSFVDNGKRLTEQDFAIDPHMFTDSDGTRYLFYATDFLEHEHIGTGTVVDRLIDWFTLAGDPQPVTRAKYDWQIYDPVRKEKGGVRWHTVEGPFVLKRKGKYYEMFSGGNWQNPSYGVSFSSSERIDRDDEWDQFSDGEKILPILRTMPEQVIGPGHNSVIAGPNNRELFCVYHEWVDDQRVLAIDRMDLCGERIFINGATSSPQPMPFEPNITIGSPEKWKIGDGWNISNGRGWTDSDESGELRTRITSDDFSCDLDLRFRDPKDTSATFCIRFWANGKTAVELLFDLVSRTVMLDASAESQTQQLPPEFDLGVFHHVRLETASGILRVYLDQTLIRIESDIREGLDEISFGATNTKAEIGYLALTKGYEDLFEHQSIDPATRGWHVRGNADIKVQDKQLLISNRDNSEALVFKGHVGVDGEFAVNIRRTYIREASSSFGFGIMNEKLEPVRRFIIGQADANYGVDSTYESKLFLGHNYAPEEYRQFRFVRMGTSLRIESEDVVLDETEFFGDKIIFGILCTNCTVALDMVRYTEI